jgi:hypothetical protein
MFMLGTPTTFDMTMWDSDLITASLYHSAGDISSPDGTTWCSAWRNLLKEADTADTILTAAQGFSGKSKCTWVLTTDAKNIGPTIKFTSADYGDFLFGFIEFSSVSVFNTGGSLPEADDAVFHLGTYPLA